MRISMSKSKPEEKIFFPSNPFACADLMAIVKPLNGNRVFCTDVNYSLGGPRWRIRR